jgi:prevent-host-death family protein
MFEIQDERFGKMKIYNVSEARANFKEVLREEESKIVVTRHGRPTKILIPFEEYAELTQAAQWNATLPGEVKTPSTEIQTTPPLKPQKEIAEASKAKQPPRWVQREADQIVSSLKGMFSNS